MAALNGNVFYSPRCPEPVHAKQEYEFSLVPALGCFECRGATCIPENVMKMRREHEKPMANEQTDHTDQAEVASLSSVSEVVTIVYHCLEAVGTKPLVPGFKRIPGPFVPEIGFHFDTSTALLREVSQILLDQASSLDPHDTPPIAISGIQATEFLAREEEKHQASLVHKELTDEALRDPIDIPLLPFTLTTLQAPVLAQAITSHYGGSPIIHDNVGLLIGISRFSSQPEKAKWSSDEYHKRITQTNEKYCELYMEVHGGNGGCCQPIREGFAIVNASNTNFGQSNNTQIVKLRTMIERCPPRHGKVVLVFSQTDGMTTNAMGLLDLLKPCLARGQGAEITVLWSEESAYVYNVYKLREAILYTAQNRHYDTHYQTFLTTLSVVGFNKLTIQNAVLGNKRESLGGRNGWAVNVPPPEPAIVARTKHVVLKFSNTGQYRSPLPGSNKCFDNYADVIAHVVDYIIKHDYRCVWCESTEIMLTWERPERARTVVKLHVKCHIPDAKKCNYCMTISVNASALRMHVRRFHPEHYPDDYPDGKAIGERRINQKLATDRFLCDQCSMSYTLLDNLQRHKEKLHPIIPLLRRIHCTKPSCDAHFADGYALAQHMISVHSAEVDASFECEACGNRFRSLEALNKHESHCASEGFVTCQKCGARVAPSRLRGHERTVHMQQADILSVAATMGLPYDSPQVSQSYQRLIKSSATTERHVTHHVSSTKVSSTVDSPANMKTPGLKRHTTISQYPTPDGTPTKKQKLENDSPSTKQHKKRVWIDLSDTIDKDDISNTKTVLNAVIAAGIFGIGELKGCVSRSNFRWLLECRTDAIATKVTGMSFAIGDNNTVEKIRSDSTYPYPAGRIFYCTSTNGFTSENVALGIAQALSEFELKFWLGVSTQHNVETDKYVTILADEHNVDHFEVRLDDSEEPSRSCTVMFIAAEDGECGVCGSCTHSTAMGYSACTEQVRTADIAPEVICHGRMSFRP